MASIFSSKTPPLPNTPSPADIAFEKFWAVFIWSLISSFVPAILIVLQNNPDWIMLIPFINAFVYALHRYFKEKKLLE